MNASDLVAAALDKRPSDFLKIFDELMVARAEALVGETKSAIAQGLVATEEDVEVDEEIESYLEYLSTLTEEEVDDEIESLDELSRETLKSYFTKSRDDADAAVGRLNNSRTRRDFHRSNVRQYAGKNKDLEGAHKDLLKWVNSGRKADEKRISKRNTGIRHAVNKLHGHAKVNASEEVENIDELSRKTLGSYVKKAASSLDRASEMKGATRFATDRESQKEWDRAWNTSYNRKRGLGLAAKKLAKEEVENIDELSRKTLGSYVKKAADAVRISGQNQTLADTKGDYKTSEKELRRAGNKLVGIRRAADKLANEESETLDLGGYQPVPGAEKDFVSKHKVEKFADRTGNGDDVYKGKTKVAKYPRADKGGAVASTD